MMSRPLVLAAMIAFAIWLCPAPDRSPALADESMRAAYEENVAPFLEIYCFGCHAEGGDEGNFTLDDYPSAKEMFADTKMWWSVLKNVRADVMPPEGEEQPTDEEKRNLSDWIMRFPFGAASGQVDPGRTTLRRLNRMEYRNTIRDLMGIDFDTSVEFPPDDSGDGFDNNADALSISPLLAEKFIAAARQIVEQAVPTTDRVMPTRTFSAKTYEVDPGENTTRLSFGKAASAKLGFETDLTGQYRLTVPIEIDGSFDFNPDRALIRVSLNDQVLHEKEYGWRTNFLKRISVEQILQRGKHSIKVELQPVEPKSADKKRVPEPGTFVRLDLQDAQLQGPLGREHWQAPDGYERFFHRDSAPSDPAEREAYATEILRRFCKRAYRRPVDSAHLEQLVEIAGLTKRAIESRSSEEEEAKTFEQRIARAMTAALASTRFLFRIEAPDDGSGARFPYIDEYALASRLSYFIWSTMPDEELFRLADQGLLHDQLDQQIERMVNDDRVNALIKNFVGQWLQTRDVESVSIDPLAALGVRQEYDQLKEYLESTETGRREPPDDAPAEHRSAYKRYREIRGLRGKLDENLRRDMRRETETLFAHVLRGNRPLLDLIHADYAFLNERLAKHYGIDDVRGDQLRRVDLPTDSPLGGILTQGTFLLVTSNPTRTSPVKRGLFILDNILGTPAPPAPGAVPELEESAAHSDNDEPTLRELLELHRSEPLCRSCHARFDPLGLAFENFTAIGTWRDAENGKPIDAGGQLISGESFTNVTELKRILAGPRHRDFYRCVAERMLSYAIGRSLDFRDEVALEQIVQELESEGGGARTLIDAVVHSPTFLRMRRVPNEAN